ncbi:hypothetical protein [Dyadobacter sp. CY312]|uniref:hypothetical protein n=1 Tax=Dyadobacter sp. CY312 TaxID=2907303 RepID=UPI001F3938FA|nr:hypothetical protein [Dyadobacter sp. CY312]MCE7039166.1 hypothetical protein [Dyadobacter sp. CY312]
MKRLKTGIKEAIKAHGKYRPFRIDEISVDSAQTLGEMISEVEYMTIVVAVKKVKKKAISK